MRQVIYVSSAVRLLSDVELADLLASARRNNDSLGVTGMLVYAGGNFLQVLEGEAGAIDTIMARVEQDARHHGLIVFANSQIDNREFGDWSMGFRLTTDKAIKNAVGYKDFFRNPPPAAERVSAAKTILRTFLRSNDR